jgi:hypothetical protein
MGTKDKLYLGIAFVVVGIGMVFFGLYDWSAEGGFSVIGMDLFPILTVVVICCRCCAAEYPYEQAKETV